MSPQPSSPTLPNTKAGRLLDKLRRRRVARHRGWRGHLAIFGLVGAFLAFMDLVTGGSTGWFLYPVGAWAIPLTVHRIAVGQRDRLWEKLERHLWMPDLVFRPFRKLHRTTATFLIELGVAASTSAFLVLVNALTGGGFWAGIPAAAMTLPLALHYVLVRGRGSRLREQIDEAGGLHAVALSAGSANDAAGPHPAVAEAERLAASIRRTVDQAGHHENELASNVDDLVTEIRKLAELEGEFAGAAASFSDEDLSRDRELVSRRLAENPSASDAHYYEKSLQQLDRQMASYSELLRRRELVALRLRTAVNTLVQLNMDLVGVKGEAALANMSSRFSQTATELSEYLGDFQRSYQDLTKELRS